MEEDFCKSGMIIRCLEFVIFCLQAGGFFTDYE